MLMMLINDREDQEDNDRWQAGIIISLTTRIIHSQRHEEEEEGKKVRIGGRAATRIEFWCLLIENGVKLLSN